MADGEKGERQLRAKKGQQLTARITQELRDALEVEAERSECSISQVVEYWLEQARTGQATAEAQLGGGDVAPALRAMARAAMEIIERYGSPSQDRRAHAAILGAWSSIARSVLPAPSPDAEELELAAEVRRTGNLDLANRLTALRLERRAWLNDFALGAADAYSERFNIVDVRPALTTRD